MHELHQNEQYFFDQTTLDHLTRFVANFANPCCLCAPMLGQELEQRGVKVRVLDIDQRFAHLKGFRTFDLYRPEWLGEEFDLIICDPPFFKVSLAQLFTAMRLLARNQYHQPMLISYLSRRKDNLLGTFARFNLVETAYYPVYQTVQRSEHNQIEFFGNLDANLHQQLKLDTSNPQ